MTACPTHTEERDGKTYRVTRYGTLCLAMGVVCTAIYTPFWMLYVTLRCCVSCCNAAGSTNGSSGSVFEGDTLLKLLDSGKLTANSELGHPGVSVLMVATVNNELSAMTLLLDRGADVNYKKPHREGEDSEELRVAGLTALICAVQKGRVQAAELLLKRGANVNCYLDAGHQGPLLFAFDDCHNDPALSLALVRLLIAHGANVNARTIKNRVDDQPQPGGVTPIMAAAQVGYPSAIEELLAAGADIDARADNGQTALMFAVVNGQVESVKLLLERGADWRLKDTAEGLTALDACIHVGGKPQIRSLLESAERAAVTPNPMFDAAANV